VIDSDLPGQSADAAVATYEQLRSDVLAGSPRGGHLGLVLLLREGVAAWIDRRPACSPRGAPPAAADRVGAAPLVSQQLHASFARVLASIALAAREETRHEQSSGPEGHC
jgi:hypothetical protein